MIIVMGAGLGPSLLSISIENADENGGRLYSSFLGCSHQTGPVRDTHRDLLEER